MRNVSIIEFVSVILFCFWIFLLPAVVGLGYRAVHLPVPKTWWARGVSAEVQLCYEAVALLFVALILHSRERSKVWLCWRLSLCEAGFLFLFAFGTVAAGYFHLWDGLWKRMGSAPLPLWLWIGLVVINPFFEETVELGYVFHAMKSRGRWPSLLASAAVRGAIHVSFGVPFAFAVAGVGLMVATMYWRRRHLLPIILVHVISDVAAIWPRLHLGLE